MPKFLDAVKGFGVTFGTMFKRPITEEYPEKPGPVAPRYHGRHQLNRYPDGLEKCIGCELCAWACPADAIYVEGADNTETERYSPGERYGRVYQLNYQRSIGCELCIAKHDHKFYLDTKNKDKNVVRVQQEVQDKLVHLKNYTKTITEDLN